MGEQDTGLHAMTADITVRVADRVTDLAASRRAEQMNRREEHELNVLSTCSR
jgi:hypothetical protein